MHSSGHSVGCDTSLLPTTMDILCGLVHAVGILWGVTPAHSDRPWEKHTQVTERPLRSVQGLSLHIDTRTVQKGISLYTVHRVYLCLLTHVHTVHRVYQQSAHYFEMQFCTS